MDYSARIKKIKRSLRRRDLDGLLITQPENRRYLCGYSAADHGIGESSGVLLIRKKGRSLLLTDSRFKEQAENETSDMEVILYPKGLHTLLETLLVDLGIQRFGFESHYTLHSTFRKYLELGEKQNIEMVPLTGIVEKMRRIKSEEEINLLRKSVRLNERVFRKVYDSINFSETEVDIALKIAAEMRRNGAEGQSFETIVAAGSTSSLPHAVPQLRKLKKNSQILIDMGLVLDGYCSDMTRTFVKGKMSKKYKKIHRIVRKAQLAGIAAVKPGVSGKQVDRAARSVIEDAGFGKYFGHALGHGVGIAVHEDPRVSPLNGKKLRPGMVITIEPGIYIPGWGGIRLEDMVVVREDGCENLNSDTTWLDI